MNTINTHINRTLKRALTAVRQLRRAAVRHRKQPELTEPFSRTRARSGGVERLDVAVFRARHAERGVLRRLQQKLTLLLRTVGVDVRVRRCRRYRRSRRYGRSRRAGVGFGLLASFARISAA